MLNIFTLPMSFHHYLPLINTFYLRVIINGNVWAVAYFAKGNTYQTVIILAFAMFMTFSAKVIVAIIVGGVFFFWVRGNNAAVSKYQSEKPDYLTILSGSVLDTHRTEVEWAMKENMHVGGNMKFIIKVSTDLHYIHVQFSASATVLQLPKDIQLWAC